MELKTKIAAEDGQHDLLITREFDLPVELLFKAYVDPEIIVQWKTPPNTTAKILKSAMGKHGSFPDADKRCRRQSDGCYPRRNTRFYTRPENYKNLPG